MTHFHNLTGDPSVTAAELTPCAELNHCPSVCDCPPGACTALAAPVADNATPDPVSMRFIIVDSDTDAEYSGTAISAASPVETMRAMIGQSFGVSRETVRLWETDNYREYGFDTRHGHRGTARFTDPAPNPYRPAPVALTHSYI